MRRQALPCEQDVKQEFDRNSFLYCITARLQTCRSMVLDNKGGFSRAAQGLELKSCDGGTSKDVP